MVEYRDRLALAMKNSRTLAAIPDRSRIQRLADALGLSYQAIKKVLDGKSTAFNALNNAKAAAFLGADASWLATGMGQMAAPAEREPKLPAQLPNRVAEQPAREYIARSQLPDVFADWRLRASPLSLEVIDGLSLLAQNDKLREEDWLVIKTLMLRFGKP